MSNQLRKATRQKAKIRLGLSAVSGGGKTYSAILIAKGLCNGSLDKVAIIDTENGSADLYAHMGNFNVITLQPPYPPQKYIDAIKECEAAGMEVIVIDSISHEWDGAGGCLDIVEDLTKKDPKHNSYTQWRFVTPMHQAFIDAILQSSAHIITTVRRKQDYDMGNQNGKTVVTKVGLKEVTRENFEYELTLNLEMDQLHNATASKDRTGLFVDKPSFVPSEATGKLILDWCESGVDVAPPVNPVSAAIAEIYLCTTLPALQECWVKYKPFQKDPAFMKAKDSHKAFLQKDAAEVLHEMKEEANGADHDVKHEQYLSK